jgi:hypothetical protein
VVGLAVREIDRGRRASVVSGWANAVSAKLAGLMPRRLTLAVSGRVLR